MKRILVTVFIVTTIFVLAMSTTLAVKHGLSRNKDCTVVLVSKQEIPANTPLDPLVQAGAFTTHCIRADQIVNGAITDANELVGQTTAATIYPNEQIPVTRLQGSD